MKTTISELSNDDRQKIVEFLQAHPVGVLATVTAEGNPHASPLYVTTADDLTISFTTKQGTQKYQHLKQNNRIMLVVFEAASQTSVQIGGKAVEANDPVDKQEIYKGTLKAARQTGPDEVPPIAKISAGDYVGFKIEIDDIWLSDYGWGSSFGNALKHANDPPSDADPS
jgi:general stress protein 26